MTPASTARQAGRNVVAVVSAELLGKGATLAFTVVVARELGATGFGAFSYGLAFGMLLATFIAWGFDSEVMRRGSADRTELDRVVVRALALRTVHTLPIVVLGGTFGVLTRPDAGSAVALVLLLLAAVLDSYGDCLRTAATACGTPGPASFALVFQRVAACVLAITALAAGGGLVAVCAAYLASSVLGEALLLVILRRLGLRFPFSEVSVAGLTELWRGAFLLGLDAVLGMALFRLDMLILGALAGDRDVAEYAVAYRLMETVLFVTWAVSRSLVPAMVRAGTGRELRRIAEGALAVAAALLVPYGVVMLIDGGAVIRLLFGRDYGPDSTAALHLLAFAPVAFALNFFCGYVLFLQQRKGWMLLGTGFALTLNVALNIVLIPHYGARGAALATTLSYAAAGVLRIGLVARGAGVFRIDRSLRLCVLASVPMAATLLLLPAPVVPDAVAGALVFAVSYLLLAWWREPAQLAVLRSLAGRG